MCILPFLLMLVVAASSSQTSSLAYQKPEERVDSDVGLTCPELILKRGYEVEKHFVTTEDGYILGLFHIPGAKHLAGTLAAHETLAKFGEGAGKPVVFLQHGLFDSSTTFVNNFANQSLAFMLADAGFDVWLGNNRGNSYSLGHTALPSSSRIDTRFWRFSWDEMALFDVPAQLGYVLKRTGADKVGYVGHSEGTIQMFAALTHPLEPKLSQTVAAQISFFGALGPVAYVKNIQSRLIQLLGRLPAAQLLSLLGIKRTLPSTLEKLFKLLAPPLCDAANKICDSIVEIFFGDTTNINVTRLPVYLSNFPSSTSTQNLIKWSQGVKKDTFAMYDYGCRPTAVGLCANEKKYGRGQKQPPLYDLRSFPPTLPTKLYYGPNDILANPIDVSKLLAELPTVPNGAVESLVIDGYAHADFVWAPDASVLVAPDLIAQLKKYA